MSGNFTRMPELWFDDGSIILNVQSHLFRVHRAVLALHCAFFRDMASLAQPDSLEMYEGLPLLTLRDDHPQDMTHFLKAVYFPHYLDPPPSKTSFEVIEGVLRLAHKYDAPSLRRCALEHLADAFTTDINLLGSSQIMATYARTPEGAFAGGELQAATALARETHALWLLPGIFYHTLQFPLDHYVSQNVWLSRARRYSVEDTAICLAGCTKLRQEYPFDMLFDEEIGCEEEECMLARMRLFTPSDISKFPESPLTYHADQDWMVYDNGLAVVCDECKEEMRRKLYQWRHDVWERFPGYFNLPNWNELLQTKKSDLGYVV
ncbi:hypothetical protein BD626DRAFT_401890 [Schizophyllum amplum]|uniref:BTB domain-containing protein n=1 Tax=Schizophyllum amplum TaxID=97359 RepID=A0A550CG41_9AGAR|nr:hypothetical protein BD626DRAFT_401890 [Auriculariopsis ampla]